MTVREELHPLSGMVIRRYQALLNGADDSDDDDYAERIVVVDHEF